MSAGAEEREEAAAAVRRLAVESFVEGYLAGIERYHDPESSAQKAWDESEIRRKLDDGVAEPWLLHRAGGGR